MHYFFCSDTSSNVQAQELNKEIFETIYYHALKASSDLAAKEGTYETYDGSPISKVYDGFSAYDYDYTCG